MTSISVKDIINYKAITHPGLLEVVTIKTNALVKDVLDTLARYEILSLVVVSEDNEKELEGFISMMDVLNFMFNLHPENKTQKDGSLEYFLKHPIRDIVHSTNKTRPAVLSEDATFAELVEFLCTSHKVVIQSSKDDKFVELLSQTDVIRFCAQNPAVDRNVWWKHRTLKDLGLVKTPLLTVSLTHNLFDAIKTVFEYRYQGAAIVGKQGKIIGNFSLGDFRGFSLQTEWDTMLTQTVQEFLDRNRWKLGNNNNFAVALETVPLSVALHMTASTSTHRVFITDAKGRGIGIVTFTDIMKKLHSFLENNNFLEIGYDKVY